MIQSLVADAVSRALDNLVCYRTTKPHGKYVDYKIAMQIHDAIIFEVPTSHAEFMYDTVIPYCMSDTVAIRPCSLDGIPFPNQESYNLGVDMKMYVNWDIDMKKEDCRKIGVPERFGK